jgi:hypothetical protein
LTLPSPELGVDQRCISLKNQRGQVSLVTDTLHKPGDTGHLKAETYLIALLPQTSPRHRRSPADFPLRHVDATGPQLDLEEPHESLQGVAFAVVSRECIQRHVRCLP